jgi:hypothetical protein
MSLRGEKLPSSGYGIPCVFLKRGEGIIVYSIAAMELGGLARG